MDDLASLPTPSNAATVKNNPTTNAAVKSSTRSIPNAKSTKAAPTTKAQGNKYSQKNNNNKTREPKKVRRTPKTTTIRNTRIN